MVPKFLDRSEIYHKHKSDQGKWGFTNNIALPLAEREAAIAQPLDSDTPQLRQRSNRF